MHSIKKAKKRISSNKSGFSFIELVVVVAIMVTLTAVALGSFVSYYGARSNKVAKTIDTMIAQSKVDALSGRKNFLLLRKIDDDYFVELYLIKGKKATRYKQEPAGNNWVTITYGTNTEISDTDYLLLKFNQKSGSVDYISVVNDSFFNPDSTAEENAPIFSPVTIPQSVEIKIKSSRTYVIQLYSASGEHIIE